jgi:hypothetical protein
LGNAHTSGGRPEAIDIIDLAKKDWTDKGGELIDLPPDEQAALMKTLSSVGADVSKAEPQLSAVYQLVTEAAQRVR